ncbi:hypothetical protein [Limnoglobus roseus]|uniref:Uncharacterized protein n=1 Tax=Limnoglobus roseus TaxID=2598579 RepID=A0A5C1AGR6_9BACT|nr:hypothetical protein [Limnoglobus roseus]QEL18619.1 hypothetical protein PX52LOC_05652 [Limnoglobus roseus]
MPRVPPSVPLESSSTRQLIPPKHAIKARLAYLCAEVCVLRKLLKLAERLPDHEPPPVAPVWSGSS